MLSRVVARTQRRRAGAAIPLLAAAACAPAERPHAVAVPNAPRDELPGPAPRGRDAEAALTLNRTCEDCHADIAREWRASLHASAHTDAVYQRAFAIEPLAFCQGCHAPEADPDHPVPEPAALLGVACVTCHVLGDEIVASTHEREPLAAPSPHPVVRDGRLGATTACAGCHEFAFPDRAARARPELMQSTVTEHGRSPERDSACAECHMPVVAEGRHPHRSHRFPGGRDAELVQSAVVVRASRTSASTVRISLTPRAVGHAFPTGDLFRRVEVSAESVGAEWQLMGSGRRYLARHWERDPRSPFGVVLRTATLDDRPLGDPSVVDFDLGERAAGLPVSFRVAYQRVEHPRSDRETDSIVEGEIVLSEGRLEE